LRGGAGQLISPEQGQHPLWRCLAELTDSLEPTVSRAVDVPTAGGTALSIQAHAAKVRNEEGQLIGTVIVLRDITALKEIEQMKARFMAGITHELKTPLAVIKLHSKNMLSYHARLPEQKREDLLTSIQSQVKLLEKLIENILELSRLDAGALKIERQPLNLATLIDRVVADLQPLAEEKQIALRWQKPAAAMTILADPGQMERVVRNLVDNALKYTPTGGSVEVRQETGVKNDRPVVKMSVIDTGMGIPLEHQRQVFDRFYRVDPSHTVPGTGLGLAIVKEIVNAHDGEINLESAPGRGSAFIVTLPGVAGETTQLPGS
jgi:signal transduction histidine kinase